MVNPELKENDPALAEVIEHLDDLFGRSYDLTKHEDAATLAEGMQQLGIHMAMNGSTASLSVSVGPTGITGISVTTTPK